MAAISRSRRSAAGIALIIAGALVLLSVLLPLGGVGVPWLGALAYAAMAVALVILAVGAVNNTLAKIALFAGAVGFAILALVGLGIGLPGVLLTVGAVLAALGFLIGAIVLYIGKEVSNTAAIVFVVAAVLAAIILLGIAGSLGLGAFATILTVALGIALVVAGFYFRRAENRR